MPRLIWVFAGPTHILLVLSCPGPNVMKPWYRSLRYPIPLKISGTVPVNDFFSTVFPIPLNISRFVPLFLITPIGPGLREFSFDIFARRKHHNWTASSEFGTYRLCEQRRFRRACASAQSRQNLRYSLIQAVSQKEPSDRKPDPRPRWMARHAQLKFVMTECSKIQIRLTGLSWKLHR